jgi:hypothetical protein
MVLHPQYQAVVADLVVKDHLLMPGVLVVSGATLLIHARQHGSGLLAWNHRRAIVAELVAAAVVQLDSVAAEAAAEAA